MRASFKPFMITILSVLNFVLEYTELVTDSSLQGHLINQGRKGKLRTSLKSFQCT